MRILVTGANGFVGAHLCELLVKRGHNVVAVVRTSGSAPNWCEEALVADIGPSTEWGAALDGVDAVIHLAARVHVMQERSEDPLLAFRMVNVQGSATLARAAVDAGVGRVVYLSSIKVNGEVTTNGPFTANDVPAPADPYGISKCEAEQELREIERDSSLELVVVRSPLVYGPNVGGNFLRMLQLVKSGVPLPFGSVRNKRTLTSVWNLVDLLERAAVEKPAAGALILAGDSYSPSTARLLETIAKSMNRRSRAFPFPVKVLDVLGRVTGRSGVVRRLTGSLEVAAGSSSNGWTWKPSEPFASSIERTVNWYIGASATDQANRHQNLEALQQGEEETGDRRL